MIVIWSALNQAGLSLNGIEAFTARVARRSRAMKIKPVSCAPR
jgi:hypothetical protein